ncbi:MAG: methionyl-tRNA formyltransferase [Muribaculaceae bacterium]|nr:methionyl-tRNA formyltransferase [Muribaculaceae bacterium]
MKSSDLKIVFFGTPDFAVASLDALVKAHFNVVAVVTMPDKPAGRGKHLQQSAVKQYAVVAGLPVLQPERLKDEEFVAALRALNADLFIVIAFRMLPEVVWTMPPLGTFNLHASLLPLYRGAAPINRAVMNGDDRTGVTTFMLKHEIDTGDILQQESIEVGPDENAGSVHDRLMTLGAELTLDTVRHIAAGDLKPIPQESLLQGVEPTPAPKIFKDDCRVDWTRPGADVHNHVRGLAPYPAAWTMLYFGTEEQGTVKILETARLDADTAASLAVGEVAFEGKKVLVGTGDGAVALLTVQPAGKRPMAASDWLRGLRAEPQSVHFA